MEGPVMASTLDSGSLPTRTACFTATLARRKKFPGPSAVWFDDEDKARNARRQIAGLQGLARRFDDVEAGRSSRNRKISHLWKQWRSMFEAGYTHNIVCLFVSQEI